MDRLRLLFAYTADMRRPKYKLPTIDDLSHSCPQCGKQVTPPEMKPLDNDTMLCPHCGDPYPSANIRKPPTSSK